MSQPIPGITVSLDELVALRAMAGRLNLQGKSRVRTTLKGDVASKLRGRGMDFSEVRAYQAGDDIRHMDWRVTARTGAAHTKIYHEERERPVYIVVDFSPSMFFATKVAFKSVIAAKVAGLLAWAAILNNDRLGGFIYSAKQQVELRPKSRQRGITSFLQQLTQLSVPHHSAKKYLLEHALARLRRVAKPGSLICLISDFNQVSENAGLHLAHMGQHNEMLAFMIRDPIELHSPPPNHYGVSNGEAIIEWDCSSTYNRHNYEKIATDQLQLTERLFQQKQIPLFKVLTNQTVFERLHSILGNKKRGYVA